MMATNQDSPQGPGADPLDATLVFHEQADGRKVSRLPGGKVVLIDLAQMDRVRDGEAWFVRLRHKETFAIAEPVERLTNAARDAATPVGSALADAFSRVKLVGPRTPRNEKSIEAAARAAAPAEAPDVPPEAVDIARLLRATDRVALFIDGANTDGAARLAGYFVDFRKVRTYFLSNATFYAGFYYVADFTASDPLQQTFFDFLSHAGFIVRRRPVKVIHDRETGERIIKGNLDTEIVLDMVNTVENYDVAFLFSGDSDFERTIELLRSRGKRVFVVSARGQLSRELAFVADKPIVYLENHRAQLARTDRQ